MSFITEVSGTLQAFAPNSSDGLGLSRAVGNQAPFALSVLNFQALAQHGLLSQPELAKTSFETSPGLVLPGSEADPTCHRS